MAQIVVSYAEADAARARPVTQKLADLGFNVVETRLSDPAPKTLPQIVLWSKASDAPPRLKRAAEPVIVARLDASEPPLIRGAHSVNLQSWRGRADHRGWRALVTALPMSTPAKPAAAGPTPTVASPAAASLAAAPAVPAQDHGRGWIIAGFILKVAAALGLGAGLFFAFAPPL
jgi:hypothetical protein